MTRRIGLLGGTFDPLHVGHLMIADQVRARLDLDEVRLVVANDPWQKTGTRAITPAHRRLAMVRAAVGAVPMVEASDIELRAGGPSYTSDTLDRLDRDEPGTEWLVVVGVDAAAGLPTWHRAEDLRRERTFVVVDRPGSWAPLPDGWRLERVATPALEVSSTEIRGLVADGLPIRHLVPDAVMHRVARWGLYRERS